MRSGRSANASVCSLLTPRFLSQRNSRKNNINHCFTLKEPRQNVHAEKYNDTTCWFIRIPLTFEGNCEKTAAELCLNLCLKIKKLYWDEP